MEPGIAERHNHRAFSSDCVDTKATLHAGRRQACKQADHHESVPFAVRTDLATSATVRLMFSLLVHGDLGVDRVWPHGEAESKPVHYSVAVLGLP